MTFRKGQTAFNKGKKMSEEQKLKISKACKGRYAWNKGKPHSKIHKKHLSENHWSKKQGYVSPLKGTKRPYKLQPKCSHPAWNKGMIGFNAGRKHYNWKGGKSFEDYPVEFNNRLKEKIRKKYNYRCQECFRHQDELFRKGQKYSLLIHHIDYNKKNNKENNLIPLCNNCHTQTNFNRENWSDYFREKVI